MDLVSIVVPVYNMGDKLKTSVDAMLAQTYKNIEIILVDDGSTDNSYEECLKLKRKDKRVKVFHQDNMGSGPARNLGIKKSSGKYIYFPDSDDYIDKNAIKILVDYMTKNNADLIVFGYKSIDTKGKLLLEKKYQNNLFDGNFVRNNYSQYYSCNGKYTIQGAPWNKFFVLDIIKKNKIEYPSLRRHQDEAFIAKYVNVVKSVLFVEEILYTYYVNDLARQWDKYPITYFENVKQLYDERKTNILIWNNDDIATHNLVYLEYICGIIKSLELSFSTKYNLKGSERKKWLKDKCRSILFDEIPREVRKPLYQRIVWYLLSNRLIFLAYIVMEFKVLVQKHTTHA